MFYLVTSARVIYNVQWVMLLNRAPRSGLLWVRRGKSFVYQDWFNYVWHVRRVIRDRGTLREAYGDDSPLFSLISDFTPYRGIISVSSQKPKVPRQVHS